MDVGTRTDAQLPQITILTQEPVLQYADFTKPFLLTCDASGYAVGAILSQGKIGHDKPSCTLEH
jgi:hypothetical protein